MYLTYNEGRPVDAEEFIITVKGKIFKRIRPNNSKSYREFESSQKTC